MRPRSGLLRLVLVTAIAVSAIPVAILVWLAWPITDAILAPQQRAGVVLVDRHGQLLRSTRAGDGSRRLWIPLSEIDSDVLASFVAMEDARFFDHGGIDLRAVGRAARDNLSSRRIVSGASTITMQAARLAAGMGRGWLGKLRQALWALRLEFHADKQTILEYYLNRVPLGQATVGVEAASALYFGRSARDLSLGQAALLAAIARAPATYDPFVAHQRAATRRDRVLQRLLALGAITEDAAEQASREPLVSPSPTNPFLAPHYTSRLLAGIATGGEALAGTWRTPLDLELQTVLEGELRHTLTHLADVGAEHAALLVLDNVTGEPLAWIGSPDFWADRTGQVDMVASRRQPGSLLKPFLYGLALDEGYTPASTIPDVMRAYVTSTGPYSPRNYDRRYHGPVRMREALASSYNVPAVELTSRMGVGVLLHTLHLAGFESLTEDANHYGLGLSLGNGEVTLLEVANAYRALANGGEWRAPRVIPSARTSGEQRRIMSRNSAALILDILSDPVARVPGFGANTPFDFDFPVAVKTGTSHHFTDNWAVGVTASFTVAVWVGNFSGRPMQRVSGLTGAGPLLQRAVSLVAQRYDAGRFTSPADAGARAHRVCQLSGHEPGPYCPIVTEWFAAGSSPTKVCDWHATSWVTVPDEYTEWNELHNAEANWYVAATAPVPTSEPRLAFRIVAPLDGDVYRFQPGVDGRYATIGFRSAGGVSEATWYVDGDAVHGTRWRLEPGRHVIRAVTANRNWDEVVISVEGQPPSAQGTGITVSSGSSP